MNPESPSGTATTSVTVPSALSVADVGLIRSVSPPNVLEYMTTKDSGFTSPDAIVTETVNVTIASPKIAERISTHMAYQSTTDTLYFVS